MSKMFEVLVLDDEIIVCERLKDYLERPSGIDVLTIVKKESYKSEVIVITGYSSMETLRQAEFIGAFEFIAKPFQMNEIYGLVKKAAKKARKKSLLGI